MKELGKQFEKELTSSSDGKTLKPLLITDLEPSEVESEVLSKEENAATSRNAEITT